MRSCDSCVRCVPDHCIQPCFECGREFCALCWETAGGVHWCYECFDEQLTLQEWTFAQTPPTSSRVPLPVTPPPLDLNAATRGDTEDEELADAESDGSHVDLHLTEAEEEEEETPSLADAVVDRGEEGA